MSDRYNAIDEQRGRRLARAECSGGGHLRRIRSACWAATPPASAAGPPCWFAPSSRAPRRSSSWPTAGPIPMTRRLPAGVFEATHRLGRRAARAGLPAARARRRRHARVGRSLSVRTGPDRFRPAPLRRGHALPRLGTAGRAPADHRRRDRRALRRVGAERPARQRRGRLQPLGRPRAPDAPPDALGDLGAVRPRARQRHPLQVRSAHARGAPAGEGRSVRARGRGAAADGVARLDRGRLRLERSRLDVGARVGRRVAGAADVDLRGAPGLVAPARRRQLPVLSRAGGHAGAVCRGHGLHARGADARDGAPLRRLLGLPGGGLLRAHRPLRHARRLPLLRGSLPPAGPRRDPRLGARPLPEG